MCSAYILAAFVIGLFVGWMVNYALTRHFFEDAYDEIAREKAKKESVSHQPPAQPQTRSATVSRALAARGQLSADTQSVHTARSESFVDRRRLFNIVTLVLVAIIFAVSSYYIYTMQTKTQHYMEQQIEKADSKAVFDNLLDGMRKFTK